MSPQDAVLGKQVFIAQQQFLIDQSCDEREQAGPMQSVIDANVHHTGAGASVAPGPMSIWTKRDKRHGGVILCRRTMSPVRDCWVSGHIRRYDACVALPELFA